MKFKRNSFILNKKFMEYLFPTILSAMSILLAAFIDGILASKICGTDAFSAVNLAEPSVLLMQAIYFIFGIGASVSISVAKGKRDEKKASNLFSLALIMGVASSIVVAVLGAIFVNPITSVMCNNENLIPLVKNYALVTFLGAPLMIMTPLLALVIRTDGMPKLSANILLVSNIVNLLMDVVYMKFLNLGTTGAALATLTGYLVGLGMAVIFFVSKKRTLKFRFPNKEGWKDLGTLCTGGLASTINTVLMFVKAILINRIVLSTGGQDAMAVFSVCNFTVSFVSMFISGGADTMTPILGMLYGEKDTQGMKIIFRKTMRVVLINCAVIVAFMIIAPQIVLSLFNAKSASQMAIGIVGLRIYAFSLMGIAICYILMNYYQTTQKKAISVMITALRGMVITVPSVFVFSKLFGIIGIWIAFVVAEFLTAAITIVVSKIKAARSNGKLKGILLLEELGENEAVFDVTLKTNIEDISGVTREINSFCKEHGENEKNSKFAAVLTEEMVDNIRRFNGEDKLLEIDLLLRMLSDEIIISVRDNGKTLSSVEPDENDEEFTNLQMIHKIADKVEYTRALGLNNTVVTLRREAC